MLRDLVVNLYLVIRDKGMVSVPLFRGRNLTPGRPKLTSVVINDCTL